jgi:hypothetical protein
MQRGFLIAASFSFAVGMARSQEALGPDALEHWRRSTIAIGEVVDSKFITVGTGLLVSTNKGKSSCIVTAKHVFFDPANGWTPTKVRIRLPKDASSAEEDLGVELFLQEGD